MRLSLLHHKADVAVSPCVYEELQTFRYTPWLYDYQLVLVDATRDYRVTSFGPPQNKQIAILFDGGHYNALASLPGFFGSSYAATVVGNLMRTRGDTTAPTTLIIGSFGAAPLPGSQSEKKAGQAK